MNIINSEIKKLNIEDNIRKVLFFENPDFLSLEWGMNHITFAPSKMIRPLLLLESNLIYNPLDNDSYLLASAVELVHTYSLVHDDLPCMDNDDLRRGVKTLHNYKNEAYAVLVGDALLTRVLDILSEISKTEIIGKILKVFGEKAGYKGMIKGQILDMDGEGKKLSTEEINIINYHKTANLLQLSLIAGAINGKASSEDIKLMEELGNYIGIIFQLQDDILDIQGNSEILGKNTGSDDKNNKSSIPLIAGINETKKIINDYKIKSIELINKLPSNKDFFISLIDYLISREK